MNYYALHIGDYASATAHLSWQEDLAYRRLLDQYYLREQPLPADVKALCRLLRAREPDLEQAVQAVLEEFFVLGDEGWRHRRCDAEIAQAVSRRESAARSAGRRWTGGAEAKGAEAKGVDAKGARADVPASGDDASPATQGATPAMPTHATLDANAITMLGKQDANASHAACAGNAPKPNPIPTPNPNPIPNPNPNPAPPPTAEQTASRARAAGEACMRMKSAGISAVNPSHPLLADLLALGATAQAFADLAAEIAERTPGKSMNYLLAVMQRRMSEKPHAHTHGPPGPLLNPFPPRRNRNAYTPPELTRDRPAVEPI